MNNIIVHGDVTNTNKGYLFTSKENQSEYHIKITNSNPAPLNLIVDEESDVKIILELLSEEKENQINKINIDVFKNSNLTFLTIIETNQANSYLDLTINVKRDASVDVLTSFLANNITAKQDINLLEENAEINLKSVVLSSKDNYQEVNTNILHKGKSTNAEMTKIGIVNNNGKIILNGIAKIEKTNDKSSSFQSLKGITTSDEAYIEVNPILLIDEYDVKAGHGATVGKVEEEVLYYLMSRGLTKSESEKLVLLGFLNPISLEIKDEDVKERFLKLVEKRL